MKNSCLSFSVLLSSLLFFTMSCLPKKDSSSIRLKSITTPSSVPNTAAANDVSVSLTSPKNGESLVAPANLTLKTRINDPKQQSYKVIYYSGSTKLGESNTAPDFSFSLSNLATGSYKYSASATDKSGNVVSSTQIQVFVTSSAVLNAENIFIAQDALGSNNGSNCANARSVSWFNASENWGSGNLKISAGDVVHLCGIVSTSLTFQGGGNPGAPITLIFENDAKIRAPFFDLVTYLRAAIFTNSKNYLVIDGSANGVIETTANGTAYANQIDGIGILADGSSNITIMNLTIQYLYRRAPRSTTDENRIGVGISLSGNNIVVKNNTLSDGDTMIGFSWGSDLSNVLIDSNTILRCNHGITIGTVAKDVPDGAELNNLVISNNLINDLDVWGGVNGNHLDGMIIFNEGDPLNSITQMRIFGNTIGPNIGSINTAGIFLIDYYGSNYPNFQIYNNVFTSAPNQSWTNGFIAGGSAGALVANNTFVSQHGGTGVNTVHGTRVVNNLFYNIGTGVGIHAQSVVQNTPGIDYSVFAKVNKNIYDFSDAFSMATVHAGGTFSFYNTLALWQSVTGWDTQSKVTDPLLVNISGGDYRLTQGSPARGFGENLSQYFTHDKNGKPHPTTGAWDAGAFRY